MSNCSDEDIEAIEAATEAINEAIAGPKRVRTDGMEVESHSIGDLIAAENRLKSKCAARNPGRGLRFTRLLPGGTE